MFLNLDAIRAENVEGRMLDWVRSHAGGRIDLSVFQWQDQDVLNHFFAGRWKQFPLSWNAQGIDSYAQFRVNKGIISEEYLQHLKFNADLVHFTGAAMISLDHFNPHCPMPTKPWSGHTHSLGSPEKPLAYVKEWFRLLHSIPIYRDWWPDVPAIKRRLRQAVNETTAQLKTRIDSVRSEEEEEGSMRQSEDDPKMLAVLLPITSSGSDINKQLTRLSSLVTSLPLQRTRLYVAIDDNDEHYSSSSMDSDRQRLEECFFKVGMYYKIFELPREEPVKLCSIVNILAKAAYDDGCFYFLLLGDDVTLITPPNDILEQLSSSFKSIYEEFHFQLPFGFGCVLFEDEASLGFPSFPVVTRIHMDIFNKEWCPHEFINQDADPYLFELYRHYGSSKFNVNLRLRNTIGGADAIPRYQRQHIEWRSELLPRGVECIKDYCSRTLNYKITTILRLDVIVPSIRADEFNLECIINLRIPPHVETTFIIILDNPTDCSYLLKEKFDRRYKERVRIRVNSLNKGASFSRNRGLDESAAEYVLFLDDDLIPDESLLCIVAEEIRKTGQQYAGYVGATYLSPWEPLKMTAYAKGAILVHLLHFWVDNVISGFECAPWGITAQLVLKRSELRFREEFPKSGGGEDIDFCLRTCKLTGAKLKNLPSAKCYHPWWDNGKIKSERFRGWAKGDSLLLQMYPEYCYRSYPNGMELILFLFCGYLMTVGYTLFKVRDCSGLCIKYGFITLVRDTLLIIAADFGYELYRILDESNSHLPSVRGLERIWCGCLGVIFYRFIGADVGHVLYPLFMRGSLRHICLRFDWWAGLCPAEVTKTRSREYHLFIIVLMVLTAAHCAQFYLQDF